MTTVRFGAAVDLVTSPSAGHQALRVAAETMISGTGRIDEDAQVTGQAGGTVFRPGDVLFGKLRPYLAKSWVADRTGEALGDIHVYRPRPHVAPRYIGYVVLSNRFLSDVNASTYGTKMPRASWDTIKTVSTYLPSRDVQTRIVDYLDRETATIDTLIEKQQALIRLAWERLDTLIEARAGGPAGESAPRLQHIAKLATGRTPGGVRDVPGPASVPWYQPEDLAADMSPRYWLADDAISQVPIYPPRSVLVCGIGATLGKAGYVDHVSSSNQQITACIPKLGIVHPRFLYWTVRARKNEILARSTGNTLPIINQSRLGGMPVPLPPLDEQCAIADHLDAETAKIDALIAKAERFIELAQERRAALITAAVTGQIEIPEAGVAA